MGTFTSWAGVVTMKPFKFDIGGLDANSGVREASASLRGQVLAAGNRCKKCGQGRNAWTHVATYGGHTFVSAMPKAEATALYAKVERLAKHFVAERHAEHERGRRNLRRRDAARKVREARYAKHIADAITAGSRRKIGPLWVERKNMGFSIEDDRGFEALMVSPKTAKGLVAFLSIKDKERSK